MSRSDNTEAIDFVARQVAGLMDGHGQTLSAALEQVAGAIPEGTRAAVAMLQAATLPTGENSTLTTGRLGTLFRLLGSLRFAGARPERAIIEFVRTGDTIGGALDDVVRALRGSLIYSTNLLLILLAVSLMMGIYVIPDMSGMFRAFDSQLPPLTRVLLGGPLAIFVVVLVGGSLCLGLGWLARCLAAAARTLTPLPRRLRRIPLIRIVAIKLDDVLAVQYIHVLLAGGLEGATARAIAAGLIGGNSPGPSEPLGGYLSAADRLGLLDEELQAQLGRQAEALAVAADKVGRRLAVGLRIVIYTIIALYVIAMYLPIFQLGTNF